MFVCITVQAQEPADESEILARRGKGVVTYDDFMARADKIPEDGRLGTLRNANRLRDLINTLLIRSQLAADAREAGFDKQQIVIDRMRLAAEAELAEAWAKHKAASYPDGDYLQLAEEYFQLHKDEYMSSPKIDVSHILVSTSERPEEEALEMAREISGQLISDPSAFDGLVEQYSEDPSAKSNKGKFKGVKKGDMVKAFEDTAFALSVGEISGPVKTLYGFHIIRLDGYQPPEQLAFEDVKDQIVESERKKHDERVTREYLASLSSLNVEMTQESLEHLVDRIFGEDYVDPFVKPQDMD